MAGMDSSRVPGQVGADGELRMRVFLCFNCVVVEFLISKRHTLKRVSRTTLAEYHKLFKALVSIPFTGISCGINY
jgi:hypothetical protein